MKHLVPVKLTGAIIAGSLFVILVSFVDFDVAIPPESQVSTTSDTVPSSPAQDATGLPDCGRMQAEFSAKLEQSRTCTGDTDCALATFGCPFGCTTSVNKALLDELQREEGEFQQRCRQCEYLCQVPLLEWRAACVRQRCIVLEQSIEDLQQETLELLNEPG